MLNYIACGGRQMLDHKSWRLITCSRTFGMSRNVGSSFLRMSVLKSQSDRRKSGTLGTELQSSTSLQDTLRCTRDNRVRDEAGRGTEPALWLNPRHLNANAGPSLRANTHAHLRSSTRTGTARAA